MIHRIQQAVETYQHVVDAKDPHIHEPIEYEFGPEEFPDRLSRGVMNGLWWAIFQADRLATRGHAAVVAGHVLLGHIPNGGDLDQE